MLRLHTMSAVARPRCQSCGSSDQDPSFFARSGSIRRVSLASFFSLNDDSLLELGGNTLHSSDATHSASLADATQTRQNKRNNRSRSLRVDATNWGETQKIIEAIHKMPLDGVTSRRDADEVN